MVILLVHLPFFEAIDPEELMNESRDNIIIAYFSAGLPYIEILHFLNLYHGIQLSTRQLNRILRRLGLYRRGNRSNINDVMLFVQAQLNGSASCQGYRTIHQVLQNHGFNVNRESIRMILSTLDPEGVQARSSRRLRRRLYFSPGPNHVWHIDGYDKLKPYGFAIHGAIDGYSRKILWLRVGKSNNDPRIIGSYFLDFIKNQKLTAEIVRTDRGSENITIGGIQRYVRRDHDDLRSGHRSFIFGRSTSNQRIEAWWSCFRRNRSNWWINYFKEMIEEDIFNPNIEYHCECLRFCFIGILQSELDETLMLWNNHRIRHNYYSVCPSGRPDTLFYAPERTGGRQCGKLLLQEDLEMAEEQVDRSSNVFECTSNLIELCQILITEGQMRMPTDVESAKRLFLYLIEEIAEL